MCTVLAFLVLFLHSTVRLCIPKVLNPITLNAILPWSFPVRRHYALFRYLLSTYDYSFLTLFIIYQLILNTFQPFCFSVMPFPDAPKIIPKSFTFFSIWYINWSYPKSIEFCVHLPLIKIEDSILSNLFNFLLISSYFSTFCKNSLLQLVNHNFQPLSFHPMSFI